MLDDLLKSLPYFAIIALVALLVLLLRRDSQLRRPSLGPPPPASRSAAGFWCSARQLLRRWSWLLLFATGLSLYPVQIYWQVRHAASQAATGDAAQAAAAEMAKVVDPALVYSKMSLALGVFCLINLLAWGALNMVLPVLADWAKGHYSTSEAAQAVGIETPVVGFKRTFLGLPPLWRIVIFFLGFALQIYAAQTGINAAFTIQ